MIERIISLIIYFIDSYNKMNNGDWVCTVNFCNETNFKKRNNCRKCNNAKPTGLYSLFNSIAFSTTGLYDNQHSQTEIKSSDWKCPCGDLNFASRNNCRKCNSAKPKTEIKAGDWKCPCGELNFASRNNCRKCNTSKNLLVKTEMKSGDWVCPNTKCNGYNFKFRDICKLCNTSKNLLVQTEVVINEDNKDVIDDNKDVIDDNKDVIDDISESNACVICLDQPKTHVIIKCGHLCYCELCGFNIYKCPICRENYNPDTDLLKIFNV